MRLIQVGLGGFGRGWASLLRGAEGVELAAVADPDPHAREWAATDLGLPPNGIYPALADALLAVDAEAVLVATPPETHRAVAEAALAAGRHVLLEKPLATAMEDGRALVAAAARADRTLMVSQNYRFRAPARAVRAAIANGAIGDLVAVSLRFRRDSRSLWPADNFRYQMRHPLLVDMSIHHADLLRAVTGREARQVYARGWHVPDSPYRHDPATIALITLDNGAVVTYEGNWVEPERETSWNGEWEILGERGRLRWFGGERDALTGDVTLEQWGTPPRPLPQPTTDAVDRLGALAEFREAVAAGREPETSGRDNLGSLAIVLGAVASVEQGEVVVLDPSGAGSGDA
jgi:predicted dehydrogenase